MTETADKLTRVRKYLKQHALDGIVLASRGNFAWASGGGDNHIVSQSERGFGVLAITAKSAYLIATNIEIDRIHNEEPVAAFTPKSFPWSKSLRESLPKLLTGKKWASDDPDFTGYPALPGDFVYECRASLTEHEIRRYKALGRDCSLVMETVCRQLSVGDSEHQIESDLARHLLARGVQPHVLLIAADQRLLKYRHPTPTANRLRHVVMLVMCGQRGGLIANLTRLVHFGPLPKDLAARHEAVCRVDTALWVASQPGVSYGDALQAGLDQYKKEGFAKEWELHHQGGPTGYAGRDFCAIPGEKRKVLDRQAVAWNPSITGTKSEDTFIIEGKTRSVITACGGDWPTVKVTAGGETLSRPAILVR